jgi:hypothetical protein
MRIYFKEAEESEESEEAEEMEIIIETSRDVVKHVETRRRRVSTVPVLLP